MDTLIASNALLSTTFNILHHIEKKCKATSSSQTGAFFNRCLPIELALNQRTSVVHVSECKKFFQQFVAKTMLARMKFFADVAKNAKKAKKPKKNLKKPTNQKSTGKQKKPKRPKIPQKPKITKKPKKTKENQTTKNSQKIHKVKK